MKNDIAIIALSLHRFEDNFRALGYIEEDHDLPDLYDLIVAEVQYLLDKQYEQRIALSKKDPFASLERLAKIDDALAEARQRKQWVYQLMSARRTVRRKKTHMTLILSAQ